MGDVFREYSSYYDLIYADKDYQSEARYVVELLRRNGAGGNRLINLGCGTGKHDAWFEQSGFDVLGVDLSETMIELARAGTRSERIRYEVGDARVFRADRSFDVVVSLFHVASYQTNNDDLRQYFSTAAAHLQPGGLFLFDFWFTPAVLTQRPEVRVKRVEDSAIRVTRIAEPSHDYAANTVVVDYDITVLPKTSNQCRRFTERHVMRYYSQPELTWYLDAAGFDALLFEEWMTGTPPSAETWGVVCVARKR